MSFTSANIETGGGGLPGLKWEILPQAVKTIITGETLIGNTVFARVPLMNPDVLAKLANLRVEFGLVRGRRYSSRATQRVRGRRIFAYANWDGATSITGTGFGGGGQPGVPARPNRLPLTNGNDLVGELPYYAFYRNHSGTRLDYTGTAVPSVSLRISGSKVQPLRNVSDFLPGGAFYNKSPQRNNNLHSVVHSISQWYCRLVEVDDAGRLVEVGPWSADALYITPFQPGYNRSNAEPSDAVLDTVSLCFRASIGKRRNV